MSIETAKRTSVRVDTGPEQPSLPPLDTDVRTDVAVLGGGIVGITAALLLQEAGVRVVLLEADRLAHGVNGEKVAGHRREDGSLVAVSTRCTHLGCQLNFNTAERSWDCPCHGSRFAPEGDVLQGPAVHPLARKAVEK